MQIESDVGGDMRSLSKVWAQAFPITAVGVGLGCVIGGAVGLLGGAVTLGMLIPSMVVKGGASPTLNPDGPYLMPIFVSGFLVISGGVVGALLALVSSLKAMRRWVIPLAILLGLVVPFLLPHIRDAVFMDKPPVYIDYRYFAVNAVAACLGISLACSRYVPKWGTA